MESRVGQKPGLKHINDIMAEATWLTAVPLNSFSRTDMHEHE